MAKNKKRLCLNCDREFMGRNMLCDSCIDDFAMENVSEKFICSD